MRGIPDVDRKEQVRNECQVADQDRPPRELPRAEQVAHEGEVHWNQAYQKC